MHHLLKITVQLTYYVQSHFIHKLRSQALIREQFYYCEIGTYLTRNSTLFNHICHFVSNFLSCDPVIQGGSAHAKQTKNRLVFCSKFNNCITANVGLNIICQLYSHFKQMVQKSKKSLTLGKIFSTLSHSKSIVDKKNINNRSRLKLINRPLK